MHKQINPDTITKITIESERISNTEPCKLNKSNSNSPSSDWVSNDPPKPTKKLNSWPEKMPAIAVDALPLAAKEVIETQSKLSHQLPPMELANANRVRPRKTELTPVRS